MTIFKEKISSNLLNVLKLVYKTRIADAKMLNLSRQADKGASFQLSCAGHELVGIVAGLEMSVGKDWSFPYYRDQGFPVGLGCDFVELFGSFLAKATVNHSSGRMMPYHYSHKKLRICCQSSVVGTQFLQAAGRAWGVKDSGKSEVVYVSGGEGATSQGEFYETLNFASLNRLPLVIVVQNNGWAISVPFKDQCGGDLGALARSYKGVDVYSVDGGNYYDLTTCFRKAFGKAREESCPSVVLANVVRLFSHSNSDNHERYKEHSMISSESVRDPILCLEREILSSGIGTEEDLELLKSEAVLEIDQALSEAENIPSPSKGSSQLHVFAPYVPSLISYESVQEPSPITTNSSSVKVMRDAISEAISEEMARDPYIVVFGEDVADPKGGVFGVTRGLTEKFGKQRCFNTPLAEATIIGTAIGLSFDGIYKPVVEIQFADYIWPGINQLFSEAASIHYRSRGEWAVPLVIRAPCGGYIQGGPYHSQNIEGFLAHCPGLKIVYPSNAADAKALLKSAIRDPNPVIFLEHKALYQRRNFSARELFSSDYTLPLGRASIVTKGNDLTIVSWGMTLAICFEIAKDLLKEGISVELIDLRTLVPWDSEVVLDSVKKTGKLLVVHEASRQCGFGAEIVAKISEEAFTFLDAPIKRICGQDCPVSYSKILENETLPQKDSIEQTVRELAAY
ncbi:MAG: thiamine pyrophosphate-dependent enzyme [Victivallaceae bacterium]